MLLPLTLAAIFCHVIHSIPQSSKHHRVDIRQMTSLDRSICGQRVLGCRRSSVFLVKESGGPGEAGPVGSWPWTVNIAIINSPSLDPVCSITTGGLGSTVITLSEKLYAFDYLKTWLYEEEKKTWQVVSSGFELKEGSSHSIIQNVLFFTGSVVSMESFKYELISLSQVSVSNRSTMLISSLLKHFSLPFQLGDR